MDSFNNALDNEVVHTKHAGEIEESFLEGLQRVVELARGAKIVAGAVVWVERDGGKERVDVKYIGDRSEFAYVAFGCKLIDRMILSNDNVFILHDNNLERARF